MIHSQVFVVRRNGFNSKTAPDILQPFKFETRKRMRPIVIVVLIVLAAAAASAQQQSSWEALETLDVDNVLKNTKLVKRYLDCLLDRGRCEKNGRDWKEMLPRILNEGCSGCTPKQVDKSNQIINFMKANHLEDWNAIDAKYRTG